MNRSLASTSTASRPYPGLRPFSREEADRLFSREGQIDQMLDKLTETHPRQRRTGRLRVACHRCPTLVHCRAPPRRPAFRSLGRCIDPRYQHGP